MKQPVLRLVRYGDRIAGATAAVAVAMIALLIAAMVYEVVSRHVFNAPTIWANDVSYMLNGSIFLLGAGYTLRRNGHVRIDFLLARLPPRLQHAVHVAFYAGLLLPVLGLTAYYCVYKAYEAVVEGKLETASAWEPVIWPFLTAIAVGVVTLTVQVVLETLRHLVGLGDPDAVESPSAGAGAGDH